MGASGERHRARTAAALGACASMVAAATSLTGARAAPAGPPGCPSSSWVAAWTASMQDSSSRTGPAHSLEGAEPVPYRAGFADQTLRLVVSPHLAGGAARLRLSNRFGSAPVTFDDVHLGRAGLGASVVPGTNHPVAFGGAGSVTVPAGGEAVSDPVPVRVSPLAHLAVSFHVAGADALDEHPTAQQASFLTSPGTGAHGGELSGVAFTEATASWYALDEVDVVPARPAAAVGALGDSITDGYLSTYGADRRWPDDLYRRLAAAGVNASVVDAGITGNEVADDSPMFGPAGATRLDHDVLALPGISSMVLFEGTNDLGADARDRGATADSIAARVIGSYRAILAAAHRAGVRVVGATITPFSGDGSTAEQARQIVNAWIRGAGAFDAVADFDLAVRDPSHPARERAAYDPGDHLHLNDGGYQALADRVPLRALVAPGCSGR